MITVDNLSVRAGGFSLEGISFSLPTGQYGFLMGRTGAGKTTLLEAICGLKAVSAGTISLMGRDVTRLKPALRGVGYVPQDGALFPSLTVREHLGFALEIRRWTRDAIAGRIRELSRMLALDALLDRRPPGLSGGEAQRVALGRALASHPQVLCLDEPLSALDEETRGEMCEVLQRVKEQTGVTLLHVTHTRAEARRLADCTWMLQDGKVMIETGRWHQG